MHLKQIKEGNHLLPSQEISLVVVLGTLGDNMCWYEAPMVSAQVAHTSETFMSIRETYNDVESWTNLFVSAEAEYSELFEGMGVPAFVNPMKTLELVWRANTCKPRTKHKSSTALDKYVQLPDVEIFDDELQEFLSKFIKQDADLHV